MPEESGLTCLLQTANGGALCYDIMTIVNAALVLMFLLGMVAGACVLQICRTGVKGRKKNSEPQKPQNISAQSGSVFFVIFAAVAMISVLGVAVTSTLNGPVRSAAVINMRTKADTQMQAAGRLAVMESLRQANGGDCDGDGYYEPLPFETASSHPGPVGGGYIPSVVGSAKMDPWGVPYGYCAWDHGSHHSADDPGCGGPEQNRLPGAEMRTKPVIVLVSAGPDQKFETRCNGYNDAAPDANLVVKSTGSDDIVDETIYDESIIALAPAQLGDLPDNACTAESIGLMRYKTDTVQVCTSDGWTDVGGSSIVASGGFAPVIGADLSSEYTSNAISFAGFSGTKVISVSGGAVILVNGIEQGTSANIEEGDSIALKAVSPAASGTEEEFTLSLGVLRQPWSIETRSAFPATLVLTPTLASDMDVGWPLPNTGNPVSFLLSNTGETDSAEIAASLSNTTNFEFYSGDGYGGDGCTGSVLAAGASCTMDVRPKASTSGPYSGTLNIIADTLNASANLSGTASAPIDCTLDGVTVPDGQSRTFYNAASSADCAAAGQSRACTAGILGGSNTYQYAACSNVIILVSGSKTTADCANANGTPVNIGAGYVCKFNTANCPSGWSQYQHWSSWGAKSCSSGGMCSLTCSVTAKAWGNNASNSCNYAVWNGSNCNTSTCNSARTGVGCI